MAVGASIYNSGQLRKSATLLINNPIVDGSGGSSDNYTPVLTCRCSLQHVSGSFGDYQGELGFTRELIMICRFQSAIVIVPDSRWQIKSNTYRIIDHKLINDVMEWYQFKLQQL